MTLNGLEYSDLLALLQDTGYPCKMVTDAVTEKCFIIRHDIDNHIERAHVMALVEAANNIRSTYYMLNYDSGIKKEDNYFYKESSEKIYRDIVGMQHHIGWHNNALTEWIADENASLKKIIETPIEYLRSLGIDVRSSASHGDKWCRKYGYVNYHVWEQFQLGNSLGHQRFNMLDFGLQTEAYLVPRSHYLSDSGGTWNVDNVEAYIANWAKHGEGNLQVLVHSQWWQ
jgi:hypothetical protein